MHQKLLKSIGKHLDDYRVTDPETYRAAEQKLLEVDNYLKFKKTKSDLDEAFKQMTGV